MLGKRELRNQIAWPALLPVVLKDTLLMVGEVHTVAYVEHQIGDGSISSPLHERNLTIGRDHSSRMLILAL